MSETWLAAGLFAGIGGIERGLRYRGRQTELLCEIDPGAVAVFGARFPGVPPARRRHHAAVAPPGRPGGGRISRARTCPRPGRTAGIDGDRSGLVAEVFRLVRRRRGGPRWLLIENVPFMLQLDRGAAMRHITAALEDSAIGWAYRVVDARAFGLPQRRHAGAACSPRAPRTPRRCCSPTTPTAVPIGDPEHRSLRFLLDRGPARAGLGDQRGPHA